MAADKMSWEQREELHEILHWLTLPVKSPMELMVKTCVRCYLNGEDPRPVLREMGVPDFTAKRALERSIIFIGNERAKRRQHGKQIIESRLKHLKRIRASHEYHTSKTSSKFTHENFRVNIDSTEDRNYGMVNVSIYAHVEVWFDSDEAVEKEYLVNFSDYKTKEWLTRLLVWGLMNDREILIKPASEGVMSSMKMFMPKDKVSI